MSQSGRNLIAQALARRALMGGSAMSDARDIRPLLDQMGQPTSLSEYNRTWKERYERERNYPYDASTIRPQEVLSPLEKYDWLPADQPTGTYNEETGYNWKRRL